ncbi:hypothetical protein [Schleiferilactobacillus shenzhenensis]|uniref:Glycosyltransferase RgtA/B/C/D-like domain-containing protein n=1 Tax=Schleiferilactobacillus shenzhenensis LY-73 TaxID=1231336 RepID=U4TRN3_9LACO|nr:hypothetical protein [Schleiferilactobacillus shenzhenensis]ERL64563.1 hypothetical protein L248_0858 [Schleiferilactobacillus shenzhenensis LY-73]
MKKLGLILYWVVKVLLTGTVGIYAVWALTAAVRYWGELQHQNAVSGKLTLLMIIVLLLVTGLGVLLKFRPLPRRWFWPLVAVLGGAALLWQLLLALTTATSISGWDPWAVYNWLANRASLTGQWQNYFSYNPNNLLLLYLYRTVQGVMNLFGRPLSWTGLAVVNAFGIAGAGVLLLLTLSKLFSREAALVGYLLWLLLIGITPWVIVPYTDTFVLLPLAAALYCGVTLIGTAHRRTRLIAGFLLGLFAVISYEMKASAIVFLIAAVPIVLLRLVPWRKAGRQPLLAAGVAVLGLAVGYGGFQAVNAVQPLVTIHRAMATPASHYLMIGAKGTGQFNQSDADHTRSIKNPQQRSASDFHIWEQRIASMGWNGYRRFAAVKMAATTQDGTYSWGEEGGDRFLDREGPRRSGQLAETLQSFVYPFGSRIRYYRQAAQLIWIWFWAIVCLALVGSLFTRRAAIDWLVISLLGSFLFLMLFEAGRTRYMIQFVPLYVLFVGSVWAILPTRGERPVKARKAAAVAAKAQD